MRSKILAKKLEGFEMPPARPSKFDIFQLIGRSVVPSVNQSIDQTTLKVFSACNSWLTDAPPKYKMKGKIVREKCRSNSEKLKNYNWVEEMCTVFSR